jgi:hypothetical protein
MAKRRTRFVHMPASSPVSAGPAFSPASAGSVSAGAGGYVRPLGKGSSSAAPKMITMAPIRQRLATDTVKIDQCRYVPGWLRLMGAEAIFASGLMEIS